MCHLTRQKSRFLFCTLHNDRVHCGSRNRLTWLLSPFVNYVYFGKRISQLPRTTVYNYQRYLQGFILWTLVNNMVYHFVFSPCPSSTAINYHQKSNPYYSSCLSFPLRLPHPTGHGFRISHRKTLAPATSHSHIFIDFLVWDGILCHVWYDMNYHVPDVVSVSS